MLGALLPVAIGCIGLALALASAPRVEAATRTWDGGGADNNWSTPANWSADTLPVAGDTVTFNGTSTKDATIDVPVAIAVFQMNAGYTGTITQNATFTLTSSYTQAAGTFVGGGPAISVTGSTTVNSGGTFNGGSSPITLTGGLTVNAGGLFTSTSGTLTVTGALTLAAGVFAHNGGTVTFSTSSVTLNLGGAATFNNVQFASGTKTLSAANTMTVLGTLTLAGGTVNTGTIAAQGNIDTQSAFAGGSTALLINGTAPQTWSGSAGGATDLMPVTINDPAGTLTLTASLRTTRNWTFTASGGLDASASSVTFAGGTISGSHTLGAVTMAGGTVTVAAGTTLTAGGTLDLFSGSLNQSGATGTVAAQGDLVARAAFTGGSATLLVNGGAAQAWTGTQGGGSDLPVVNVNKGGGTLSMAGTLRTTRNWTWTAGGFADSGSGVTFAGGTITGSHTLGGIAIAGTVTVAAGTTVTATGTLSLTSGVVNTGTLAAQGDVSAGVGFTGGSGALLVNGASAQSWTGSATSTTGDLPMVTINKPGGTLTVSGTLRTTRNWTYTAGGVSATGSTLIFSGTQTITGSHTLDAVDIRGGTVTIAAGTTLTAAGAVNLVSGGLNTGTLAAQGNIASQVSYTGGGTATLLINGAGAQTLTGFHTTIAGSLPNVDINKGSGTLTLSGTIRTARNWTYTAGGLAASGTTLVFNGTQTIAGSHTLDAVEIRGGTVTITGGTTVTATGTVNLVSGAVNTGTLAAQGNLDAQVTYTGSGTATLLINGAAAQTFTGFHTTATGSLPNVDIAKPSGTLTLSGILRTGRNWTYTSGGLVTSGTTLVFAGTLTIAGSHTLDAVEIAGTVTIAAGTTVTAAGTVNLVSGALNTGTLAAQGNIASQVSYTGSGTATLLINGAGAQTLTGLHTTVAGSMPNVDINKSSGTLTIAGTVRTGRNWTYTAGGLVTSGTTLVFAGTLTITGSHTLDAVEIAGTVTIAAGTTVTAAGNVTLTSGSLSGGTLAATADVTSTLGYTGGGTATLLINGAGAQTLTGLHTTAAGSLPNLDISKSSGTLTLSGTIRTGRNWTYTSGGLVSAGSTVIFSGTQTVTGSHTLATVEVRATALTIAAGTTLTVAGPLNLVSGSVSGGTLAAEGNVDAQVTYTGGGSATLLVNGTGAQTLTGFHTPAAGSLPNLDIGKASGTLTISGTIRTGRNWTYTSGALAVAGSTVIFNGSLTVTGDHALDAVEFHSSDVTVAAGTTLTVGGLLTLTDGNLNTGTVDALGNIVIQAAFDGESGTVRIAGTTDQTLTGFADSTTSDMASIVIDKPSGTLHLVGTVRMTTSSWTWLQGAVDAGGSTVYFDSTVTISGTHSLFNVYLSGGTHTVNGGDTLTALGTLTLDNGTITGGTIAAEGPVIQLSTFDGGTGLLAITGGATRSFTGSATTAAGNLPDVEISTSGGTLTLVGTIRTANDWTHQSGTVDAGTSTVVFAGTLAINAALAPFNDILVNGGTASLLNDLSTTGSLTVAAGTLATGAFTVYTGGNVTVDGAITATSGTLEMNGLSGQTLGGSAAISLFNLTVSDPAGVTQATTVSVAGTLTLVGPLDFSGESLTIGNPLAGVPTNLTCDASSTLAITGSGAGIVIPASIPALGALTVSNPNGVALAAPLSVATTLTLTSGAVDTGGSVLSIGPAGSVVRTSGRVNGLLQKWVAIGSGVSLTFEIGDATTYAPVSVTFGTVSVTGQLTASTLPGEHPSIGSSILDPAQDVNRWWTLTNAAITFDTLDAAFTFVAADRDIGSQPSQFIVAKWDGSWSLPTSGGNTATSVTAYGLASLSEFAVGEAAADLTILKGGPAFATAGDPAGFDYTLTVHNAGPADNVTGFTVSDTLPGALTFQAAGSDSRCGATGQVVTCTNLVGLASGADDLFVIHVTLASTADGGTFLSNTATVASSGTNDPDASNDASTLATEVEEDVELSANKAFDSATITAGGASGTFTIIVTNGGDSDADNVVLTDLVDPRLTVDSVAQGLLDCSFGSGQAIDCRIAHLAGGASVSITVTYHAAASVATATVANHADVTSDEDDAPALDSIDVLTAADVADIGVDSPDPVAAGGTLTFRITVSNLGPSDALSVTLTDVLDASLTGATYCVDSGSGCGPSSPWTGSVNLGTIPAGGSVDVVITATVDPATPSGTVIANTATAGTTTPDPDGANNTASTATSVDPPAPTPSGSIPDTRTVPPSTGVPPLPLLLGAVAWVLLLAGLATGGARERRSARGPR